MLAAVIYRFGEFELDLARVELRADGAACPLEPQVFALLALLVENRERLVSRDEIIEKVWDGRVVSDAAIASRVKSARQALGDDGKAQRFIRTMHRQGFRFVAPARAGGAAPRAATAVPAADGRSRCLRPPGWTPPSLDRGAAVSPDRRRRAPCGRLPRPCPTSSSSILRACAGSS